MTLRTPRSSAVMLCGRRVPSDSWAGNVARIRSLSGFLGTSMYNAYSQQQTLF